MGRRIGFGLLAAMLLAGHPLRAQWVVSDPSNLAQGIVNSTKQVVEASRNGSTLLQSFQQTVKIYEQSKKYYDALPRNSRQWPQAIRSCCRRVPTC